MNVAGTFQDTSWLIEHALWYALALALCLLVTRALIGQEASGQGPLWEGALWIVAGAAAGAIAGALLRGLLSEPQTELEWGVLYTVWLRSALLGPPSIHGAIAGALAAIAVLGRWYPMGRAGDLLAVGAAFGGSLLWLGAARLGYAYGKATPWGGAMWLPDGHGLAMARWPVQPIGAIALALLALLACSRRLYRTLPPGILTLLLLWAANVLLLSLGFVRADPAPLVGPLRGEQLGALCWMLLAALLLPWRWRRASRER